MISTHIQLDDSTPEARDTIRRFTEMGKHLILMEDVPILSFDPRACIKRAGIASSATRSPCALPRAEVDRQTPAHDLLLAAMAREFPTVELFATRDLICDAKLCWAMKDGKLLYRDKNHLSYEGDLYIGEKFAEWQALRGAKQAGNALQ